MLYKLVAALAIVQSADALNIGGMSRRTAIAKAASLAPLIPLAAFADLKKAGDAEIYKRADENKLNAARVIERAKTGDLVDGSSATCAELDALLEVDPTPSSSRRRSSTAASSRAEETRARSRRPRSCSRSRLPS
jgi:hypothetical protein